MAEENDTRSKDYSVNDSGPCGNNSERYSEGLHLASAHVANNIGAPPNGSSTPGTGNVLHGGNQQKQPEVTTKPVDDKEEHAQCDSQSYDDLQSNDDNISGEVNNIGTPPIGISTTSTGNKGNVINDGIQQKQPKITTKRVDDKDKRAQCDTQDYSLPPRWEKKITKDGKPYYVDHNTETTTWTHPSESNTSLPDNSLPPDWEKKVIKGRPYYIDHNTKTATWTRPSKQVPSNASLPVKNIPKRFGSHTTESLEPSAASGIDIDWNLLKEYISALPDNVEVIENCKYNHGGETFQDPQLGDCENVKIKMINEELHIEPVNNIHNLLFSAVKCASQDPDGATTFINNIIKEYKLSSVPCLHSFTSSEELSFEANGLKVTVEISDPLMCLLQNAAHEKYTQNSDKKFIQTTINYRRQSSAASQNSRPRSITTLCSDVQAIMALVVVLKCYPPEWQLIFFWDAWLAVTIQLGLLQKVKSEIKTITSKKTKKEWTTTVFQNEVFPCQWLKQVFYAERLLGSPENVKGILMGNDPVSKVSKKQSLSTLRKATGIAYHKIGNNNKSIRGMTGKYGINCTDDNPIVWCKDHGLLLVNMIRCIFAEDDTLEKNTCYNAWKIYNVKLAKHFANKQMILTSLRKADLLKFITIVKQNEMMKQVPHPRVTQMPIQSHSSLKKADKILEHFEELKSPPSLRKADNVIETFEELNLEPTFEKTDDDFNPHNHSDLALERIFFETFSSSDDEDEVSSSDDEDEDDGDRRIYYTYNIHLLTTQPQEDDDEV